jgi:uroporphyrinogen-III synthase
VGYVAACIGPSTLKEAQRLGFRSCVSPEASRGADGLAQTILDAALTVAQESKAKAKCL